MYNLLVLCHNPSANFQFGFKDQGGANTARHKVKEAMKSANAILTLTDDYGQTLDVPASMVAMVFMQCQKGKCELATEQNIDQARHNEEFIARRNESVELMRLFPGQTQNHIMGRA